MSHRTEHAQHAGPHHGSMAHGGQVAGNAASGRLPQGDATLPRPSGKVEEMIALLANRLRDPADG